MSGANTHYAIADISSGRLRYSGKSEAAAARYLYAGGTWGTGFSRTEAEAVARAKAAGWRAKGYVYRPLEEVA